MGLGRRGRSTGDNVPDLCEVLGLAACLFTTVRAGDSEDGQWTETNLNDAFLLVMALAGKVDYLITGDRRTGLLQRGSRWRYPNSHPSHLLR